MGKLIRKLYGVLRLVHHLRNVTLTPGKAEPRTISRMVEMLSGLIKPAYPMQRTTDLIVGNAKNWGHCTYVILQDHFETGMDDLLEEVSGLLTPDCKEAFKVVVHWATRYVPNITKEAIEYAKACITAVEKPEDPVLPRQPTEVVTQTQAPRTPAKGCSVATMVVQTDMDPMGDQELVELESLGPPEAPG